MGTKQGLETVPIMEAAEGSTQVCYEHSQQALPRPVKAVFGVETENLAGKKPLDDAAVRFPAGRWD